ncbi:MlaD family protein [Melioribacteraceae bacterium 4301-Me]|uniref:MlaD family protein n=1 Tax=Pyranulibacter aquaticus TaxID=3163344 RepID=UPI0035981371
MMKEEQRTEIKVGITVLIGIIIFIWVFSWAKNISINSEKKNLNIIFDSVAGLENGDVVTVNGVRQGYVDKINNQGNLVLVNVKLNPNVDLRKDATFSIMMLDLMGGKKIEINPGISNEKLDYSISHRGKFIGDISTAMSMLSSVQSDLVDVIREVKVTLKNTNELLGNKNFSNDIKVSVNNLNRLTKEISDLIISNRENIHNLILETEKTASSFNNFYEKNQNIFNETLDQTKKAISSSNELLKKLNTFFDETKEQKNNIGKVIYNQKLIDDLQINLEQLKELTRILIEQLKGKGINVDANIF